MHNVALATNEATAELIVLAVNPAQGVTVVTWSGVVAKDQRGVGKVSLGGCDNVWRLWTLEEREGMAFALDGASQWKVPRCADG